MRLYLYKQIFQNIRLWLANTNQSSNNQSNHQDHCSIFSQNCLQCTVYSLKLWFSFFIVLKKRPTHKDSNGELLLLRYDEKNRPRICCLNVCAACGVESPLAGTKNQHIRRKRGNLAYASCLFICRRQLWVCSIECGVASLTAEKSIFRILWAPAVCAWFFVDFEVWKLDIAICA